MKIESVRIKLHRIEFKLNTYMNNKMYKYTKTWFLTSELRKFASQFINKNQTNKILEIGSYEGLSSVFFADNFLNNGSSFVVCVDPFLNTPKNVEDTFYFNIAQSKNHNKILYNKTTSDEFFKSNKSTYTFVYIDGCHKPEFVMRDMENSFKWLEKGGIMWMDDYLGGDGIQIRNTMNDFLKKYEECYEIIHKGYQLAIKKI